MNLHVSAGTPLEIASDLTVLGAFENEPLPDTVTSLFESPDFSGRVGQMVLLYPGDALPPARLLLLGLGSRDDLTAEVVRRAAATAIRRARELQAADVVFATNGTPWPEPAHNGQAFAEGVELGSYQFLDYREGRTPDETFAVENVTLVTSAEHEAAVQEGVTTGQKIAGGVVLARNLVNRPGYAKTPAHLGDEAVRLGKELGLKVTVLDKAQLADQGFGGILAVGQGSANEPRFIVMEHGDAAKGPTICLVGKGLTFDSGGLSLKPAEAMETMKNDMGGAAAVFGAMQAVAALDLPVHVVGIVSAAENMPSGTAYRPGDVVRTLSGKTVEVLNTDAEGRIILSDGLFYAQRYDPAAIIELSTLTGAIIIALANHATGMMATDQALADQVRAAGEVSHERVWQLPLWDEYRKMIVSDIADIKNMAGRPAGSITAGAFLAEFVGDYPFVHLDVAGTAWKDSPTHAYESKGGTGVGVRLLVQLIRDYRTG